VSSIKRIVARFLEADLNPPLGYPGGSCYFQERVREEVGSDKLVNQIMLKHLQNKKLTPVEEKSIYDDMYWEGKVKGTFFELFLTAHAQYRMDLRGVTVSDVKNSLREFQKEWSKAQSRGGPNYYTNLLLNRDVRWKSTNPRFEMFFTVLKFVPKDKERGQKMEVRIRVDSVFFSGGVPEDPVLPKNCDTWKNWEGWSGEYEEHGLDRILPVLPNRRNADLNPPLGYPGGSCHTIQRVHEEVRNPNLRDNLVDKLEEGKSLSNSEARKVYKAPQVESGTQSKLLKDIVITSHAQYRMDQRGITAVEIRLALKQFVKAFYDGKSQKSVEFMDWSTAMAYGEPIRWVAKVPKGLTVMFQISSGTATVVTVYWEKEQDPRPQSEESCGFPSAGRVARKYAMRITPTPGVQTFVTEKSQEGLPTSVDHEKQVVLPPGSATPGGEGRNIGPFSYNGPDSESDISPRTLGTPGEERGHPTNFVTPGTMSRRTMTSSRATIFWEEEYEDLEGDPWEVAESAGINILRGKEFRAGFQVDGEIVAVLFDESDRDGYSFDIAVSPNHRRQGFAKRLLDIALDLYEDNREAYGEEYTLNLDVVSPIMEKVLKGKGFVEVGRQGGHTMMTRVASSSIPNARTLQQELVDLKSYTDHFERDSDGYPLWYFVSQGSLTSTPDYGVSNAALPRGAEGNEIMKTEEEVEGTGKTAYKRRWKPGQRQRKSRGRTKTKRKEYNRKNRAKRRRYSQKWRDKNKNKGAFRSSEKKRRRSNRRRRGSVLTVPDIAFLIGPEMLMGYIHSISPISGMVTIELEGSNVSQLDSLPVEVFLRMAVFLTEQDINSFFELVDVEIGPQAYEDMDESMVKDCARRYDRDPDSDDFKNDCFELTDEYELSSMGADQLEAVTTSIVQGNIDDGFSRSVEDADDPEIGDEYDPHLFYGEVEVDR